MKYLLVLFSIAALNSAAQPKIVHVHKSATGLNDGTSWANAFTDLQLGLEAVSPGDEIWVAQGVYYPSKDIGNVVNGPREKYFTLVDSVGIYGGFAGNETARNQRDLQMNPTVLSGDLGSNTTSTDNSYHVVASINDNLSEATILDGFFIREGRADLYTTVHSSGGGILIYGQSRAVLKNLTIIDNYAWDGGGLAIVDSLQTGRNGTGTITVLNCKIRSNFAVSYGAGLYVIENRIDVNNCLIVKNEANLGGGIYCRGSTVNINNCTIEDNLAITANGIRSFKNEYFNLVNSILNDTMGTILSPPFSLQQNHTYQNNILKSSGGSSNWQFSAHGVDLGGNMDTLPGFIGNGNYRLLYTSPGFNAGDSTLLPFDDFDLDEDSILTERIPLDVSGGPRLANGQVDIGAFEYDPIVYDSLLIKICPGGQFAFDSLLLDSAGFYTFLKGSPQQVDSVIYLSLAIDSVNSLVTIEPGGVFHSLQDSARYQWMDCSNDSILASDTLQNFTPAQNGTYSVIITNQTGCTDTSACYAISNVGLSENRPSGDIELYPNPAQGQLNLHNISAHGKASFQISIYDQSGKQVYGRKVENYNGGVLQLDVSGLVQGFYTLQILGRGYKFWKE